MFKKITKKYLIFIIAMATIFAVGYYLRAYYDLYTYLPGSPYEIFTSQTSHQLLGTGQVIDYKDKASRYPISQIAGMFLNPIFGNFYLVYLFGAIAIYFLGKEITGRRLGGLLAFAAYAVAGENLLIYMRGLGASGLCYVFMLCTILFLTKYLNHRSVQGGGQGNRSWFFLSLFVISALLALTTYHTGATALIMLLIGFTVSIIYSSSKTEKGQIAFSLDLKLFWSIFGLGVFYITWLKLFDPSQFILIINSFGGTSNQTLLLILLAGVIFLVGLWLISKLKFLESEYLPLVILPISAILIFSNFNFFGFLLQLGVDHYYVSATSLNNYFAQALLLHIYVLAVLAKIWRKLASREVIIIRGWLIGLALVLVGLVMEHFYARILDYSFFVSFILFAWYWSEHQKFRKIIVPATLILLVASQFMIFHDSFSLRRYYTKPEVESAQKIVALNLVGPVASDLRTSALLGYLGETGVLFSREDEPLHESLFYHPENVKNLPVKYVVLSQNMRFILYGMNFETQPIGDAVFAYYHSHFTEVYKDNLLSVYSIHK